MEGGGSKSPPVLMIGLHLLFQFLSTNLSDCSLKCQRKSATPLILLQSDDKKCAEPLARDVLRSMTFTPQCDKNPNTFNNFNANYESSILFVRKTCAVPADTFSKAIHTTFPRV